MADLRKCVLYFEVLKAGITRKNVLQQRTESRNIPLSVSEIVQENSFGFCRRYLKSTVKAGRGALHSQVAVQDN